MLRIDRKNKRLDNLTKSSLGQAGVLERSDLQEYIFNCPEQFFSELGLDLFIIGKEIAPSDSVLDRIDLLCLDKDGNAVIVELKRGENKLQMLQAIAYAAMISKWQPDDFKEGLGPDGLERLSEFLVHSSDDLNREQKIVLIAEGFDYSILISAEWLAEQYGVAIACCQLSLVSDQLTKSEYLICSNVFPNPEIAQQAAPRRRARQVSTGKWPDWESAIDDVQSPAVADFCRKEIEDGCENHLPSRVLWYRINGKRLLHMEIKRKHGYCWQYRRFANDEQFWKAKLSQPEKVEPINDGRSLRFYLTTTGDFIHFKEAIRDTFPNLTWDEPPTSVADS
jgi:hypothetical protein